MRYNRGLLAGAASAAVISVSAAVVPAAVPPSVAPLTARTAVTAVTSPDWLRDLRLTAAIRRAMRQAGIPGAIVGVWQPGHASYVRTFGVRDKATGAPMSTRLFMRIGSETKTFTATAMLQLVDQHKIGLDDPISTYVRGVPDGRHITLRELAEMRSGLLSYTANPAWIRLFLRNPHRQWKPRQLLPFSFSQPLLFPPGTKFNYSNINYVLLGLVIEKVSRLPLAVYFERHILRPSGLRDTFLPRGARFPRPHAQGYTVQDPSGRVDVSTTWNPSWGWAAGALISNLGNLRTWAKIVATGTLLTPATQRQRERFLPTFVKNGGYGLGLFDVAGWIGHNGSIPGYESLTMYLPSTRTTLVALINTDILVRGVEPSSILGRAITRVISPRHVYFIGPTPGTR